MTIPAFPAQTLPDRAVIAVIGETALAFLHNLLTAELTVARPAYAALLTPQGKILHDVFVVPAQGRVWLDVARTQADALVRQLLIYRLRAKLDIAHDAKMAVAVSSLADLPGVCYADPRLAQMGFRAVVDAGCLAPGDGYEACRLALGLADSELDIGSGEMFTHEANLDLLGAVSVSKGCYVGQEVVSRTRHRGSARSRILPVAIEGVADRGAAIMSGEQRLGVMLSSKGARGLALINLQRLADARKPLTCGDGALSVQKPAWMGLEIAMPEAVP